MQSGGRKSRRHSWKAQWHQFTAEKPGRRFRNRYERRRADGARRAWWHRALNIAIGIVLLAVGVFFAVAPGPAVVFFALGGLMIANESHMGATALDRIDVWFAPVVRWLQRHWRKLSPLARRVVTGCAISASVAGICAGVLLMR